MWLWNPPTPTDECLGLSRLALLKKPTYTVSIGYQIIVIRISFKVLYYYINLELFINQRYFYRSCQINKILIIFAHKSLCQVLK